MIIRKAQDKDYAEIARLHRKTIRTINAQDYPPRVIAVWSGITSAQRFRESADMCNRWVAVKKSKIVGYCDHNFNCEIWGLYVHADYLKKGIGKKLLTVLEKSLKKQGCGHIQLKATITAKSFYLKHGYRVVKKIPYRMQHVTLDIYRMSKKI